MTKSFRKPLQIIGLLLLSDKDFGEKVYREQWPHRGVVLLRLENERAVNKIAVIQKLLEKHQDRLIDMFVVATESRVRFAPLSVVSPKS